MITEQMVKDASKVEEDYPDPAIRSLVRDLLAATGLSQAEGARKACAALNQGSAGGNDPADCDWPMCGCDPHADKVVAALHEQGLIVANDPEEAPTRPREQEG